MRRRWLLSLSIVTALPNAHAPAAWAGAIMIGNFQEECWCEESWPAGRRDFIVWRQATEKGECDLVNVAFRITGVVPDPNLSISIPFPAGITGDPFGDGAVIGDFIAAPGNVQVLLFQVEVTGPVPPQVWTVEAHLGISGTSTPVASFQSTPGVWRPEVGLSMRFGSVTPDCDSCAPVNGLGCPFAVEPATWSTVKHVYR